MYLAHVVQQGDGCDYTIGCGHKVMLVAGDSLASAKENLINELTTDHGWSLNSEIQFSSITLYRYDERSNVDLSELLTKMLTDEKELNDRELRRRELEELERLQRKYKR